MSNSPVADYLSGRGIKAGRLPHGILPPSLRFHPCLTHRQAQSEYPAMLGAIQDGDGVIIGVQRTYLAKAGYKTVKASVKPAKMVLGNMAGGAVRLGYAGQILGLAEGIETALSVMQATGHSCWAAVSSSNMSSIPLPPIVNELHLYLDADCNQDVIDKMLDKAKRFYRGVQIRLIRPPQGMDFNDLLCAGV